MAASVPSGSAQGAQTVFPPAPWHLGASGLVSVFFVPDGRVPSVFAEARPTGWRPLRVRGRTVVTVGSLSYSSGGVLAYDEVLVASPVRRGRAVAASIPQIWVDSEASRDGARALWGIPKDLAQFQRSAEGTRLKSEMSLAGSPVVRLDAKVGLPLTPRRIKLPDFALAQRLGGVAFLSRHFAVTGVRFAKASWDFAAAGPLGYLRGLRPFVSFAAPDTALVFGFDTEADLVR
jgi:hypothetical protein